MSGPRALEDDPVSFQDKTLTCKDCGQEFIWTAGEQEFYASRGLQNAPTRCPAVRAARRGQGGGRGGGGGGGYGGWGAGPRVITRGGGDPRRGSLRVHQAVRGLGAGRAVFCARARVT